MLAILVLSARLAVFPPPAPPDSASFTAAPATVAAGGEAVLRWRVPGAREVFISGLGVRPARGEATVRPTGDTRYSLVGEAGGRALVRTVLVRVTGVRGPEFPSEDDERYRYPVSCGFRGTDRVRVLGRIHAVLNDSLGMQVREYTLSDLTVYFATLPQISPGRPREWGVAYRRASYIVSVPARSAYPGTVPCSIRTFVEYRLGGESTWRPESDSRLYTEAGLSLRGRLWNAR